MRTPRSICASVALAGLLAGWVGQAAAQVPEPPTVGQRPAWQQMMDEARRLMADGDNYVLVRPSGVFVFYNNPLPFCYKYMIPGEL